MTRIVSFPPVCGPRARTLILGTMPGEASLRIREYYGHPRNQFWQIIGSIAGFDYRIPYEERLKALVREHLALWDVVAECRREGSLDSAIKDEQPNGIRDFLAERPLIKKILFNGGPAQRLFRRHFNDILCSEDYCSVVMPSTSPACARYTFEEKLERWRRALLPLP
ncbi:MAG: DNA-deoxyinosine glycosylase [Candidatus Eremiobacteraeota bacterium]|nr:DNA-deoxyinosine glycosylase [Candidatus Eremiobacteraeota bacterium]